MAARRDGSKKAATGRRRGATRAPGAATRSSRPRHRGRLPFTTQAGDGVVVNGYSEQWLGKGFPWVYADEVVARTGSLLPGRVVSVRARDGRVLGTGVWDQGRIEVRRFRGDQGPIDADLLRERLRAARARRPLHDASSAWRWVHAENDDLPGIRVDVWGRQVSITLDSPSLSGLVDPLLDVITDQLDLDAVWLCWRPEPGDEARFKSETAGLIWGRASRQEVVVQERGMRMAVRPWDGADAGLYNDMRDVRAWLEPHWRGRRVLNTFAFTGAFSVAAARHGAAHTVTVDLAQANVDRSRGNFVLNDLDPVPHGFVAEDTFKALDSFRRRGELFDLVVADPPSFSHDRQRGRWSVEKDLGRLVSASLRVLAPGGWLVVASNHGKLSPREFGHQVHKGAQKAGRGLRLVHEGSTPVDFPAALDFPESRYLKCWVLAG